jgi:uncharacterized membrane protein HdeD (DUF308 family)
MDILVDLLQLLWYLGLAGVFGGFLHQAREKNKNITWGMFIGGIAQLVAFALLLIYNLTQGAEFDVKTIIMLVISLAIAALTFIFRGKTADNMPVWLAAGLLSVLAFALPLFW